MFDAPRIVTDEELEANRCIERRSPRGTIRCEKRRGHETWDDGEHAARGRTGQWFFWNGGEEGGGT